MLSDVGEMIKRSGDEHTEGSYYYRRGGDGGGDERGQRHGNDGYSPPPRVGGNDSRPKTSWRLGHPYAEERDPPHQTPFGADGYHYHGVRGSGGGPAASEMTSTHAANFGANTNAHHRANNNNNNRTSDSAVPLTIDRSIAGTPPPSPPRAATAIAFHNSQSRLDRNGAHNTDGGSLSLYGAAARARTDLPSRGGGGGGFAGITSPAYSPPQSPRGNTVAAEGDEVKYSLGDLDESYYRNNNLEKETAERLRLSSRVPHSSSLNPMNLHLGGIGSSPAPNPHLSPIAASVMNSAPSAHNPFYGPSASAGTAGDGMGLSRQFANATALARRQHALVAEEAAASVYNSYSNTNNTTNRLFTQADQTNITGPPLAGQQHAAQMNASFSPQTYPQQTMAENNTNTDNKGSGVGKFSVSSTLSPSPEALHAAALSLRRQEEALNARELQLKMKEEELTRREFAIRQIVLEALDVQGIAMVGGSTAAPNVAQALANLNTTTSGSEQQPQGGGRGAAAGAHPAGNQQLYHTNLSVLEEQMIHFRDEFRRQRTQLRQLYEELNTRERELEAAAVSVKKFEQQLKLREMELDTRSRTLLAEEDDVTRDVKQHATAINLSAESMRKKLEMLEEHEKALERLVRDLDIREADLNEREEVSKKKIIEAKEAEDHIIRTLERAHDLELKAKELAMASDRLRIREEALWPAVTEIANTSSVREAKAAEEVEKAREEVLYLRRALDSMGGRLPPSQEVGAFVASPTFPPPADRDEAHTHSGNSGVAGDSASSTRNIMRELERIGAEIRNAAAANNGVPFHYNPYHQRGRADSFAHHQTNTSSYGLN